MSKELVKAVDLQLPALPESMNEIGSDFLSELKFCASSEGQVKKGLFNVNHYALKRGKDYKDLGKVVNAFIVRMTPKALDVSGDRPVSSFSQGSEAFEDIKARSNEKDSGCMWGPECLIWVPSAEEFAVMFLRSKTLRNENGNFMATYGRGCTLSNQLISSKKFDDYSSVKCDVYQGEITDLMTFTQAQLDRAVKKFDSQKEYAVETIAELEAVNAPIEEEKPKRGSKKRG